ncbi:MAG TPA: fluoride efflux transporter CrcB [Solirubrobacteraceae bacterium]|jgi:CrcB protein|nr:fluoride efflux transporter CrcB [Solirubrobacteraceae bacterium]
MPRVDARELAAIFAGGCVGGVLRAALAEGLPHAPGSWPWATFAVNLVGALLLGWFVTRLDEHLPPSLYARPLLATGLCGALTTFSTMMVEVLRMIDGGHRALAGAYAATSIVCGLAAIFASTKLVRRARLAS